MSVFLKSNYAIIDKQSRYLVTPSHGPASDHDQIWEQWFTVDDGTHAAVSAASISAMRLGETLEPDMFGEGRSMNSTRLSFLDFEGHRGSYGETPDDFEFHGYGQVRSLGLPDRDVHVRGLGHMVGGTPVLKSFKGHVIIKDVEGHPWPDISDADLYSVKGLVEAPRTRRRAKHNPPSRAYEMFKELALWLRLSDDELAKIIGVSRTTAVDSWKRGSEPRNRSKVRRLYQLHAVAESLHKVLGDGLVAWLERGQPSPLKLLATGKYDRFERLADAVIFPPSPAPRPRLDAAKLPSHADTIRPETERTPFKRATRARSRRLER